MNFPLMNDVLTATLLRILSECGIETVSKDSLPKERLLRVPVVLTDREELENPGEYGVCNTLENRVRRIQRYLHSETVRAILKAMDISTTSCVVEPFVRADGDNRHRVAYLVF